MNTFHSQCAFPKYQDMWNAVVNLALEFSTKDVSKNIQCPTGNIKFILNKFDPRQLAWEVEGIQYHTDINANVSVMWETIPDHVIEAYAIFQTNLANTIIAHFDANPPTSKQSQNQIKKQFPLVSKWVAHMIEEHLHAKFVLQYL